jgi:hypothetical protein
MPGYVERHPWWSLFFGVLAGSTAIGIIQAVRGDKPGCAGCSGSGGALPPEQARVQGIVDLQRRIAR